MIGLISLNYKIAPVKIRELFYIYPEDFKHIFKLINVKIFESIESKWFSSLPETLNSIFVSSEITSGLAFKLWGDMGVNTKEPLVGEITGPPQLKE